MGHFFGAPCIYRQDCSKCEEFEKVAAAAAEYVIDQDKH